MKQISQLSVRANAKINLVLDIVGRREDGYHLLSTVMQSVDLHDNVTVTLTDSYQPITVTCSDPSLPCDRHNLAYRAAEAFFAAAKEAFHASVAIHIEKKIPLQAGLAGGSADAAAVLFALNRLAKIPLSQEILLKTGASLGADVPFCLTGGTLLAQGIGDKFSPLPALKHLPIVIVKPPFSSSTAEAYAAVDRTQVFHPDTDATVLALQNGNLADLGKSLGNSFESVIYPQKIGEIKQRLDSFCPFGSAMSGSGSAVFALFESIPDAQRCYRELSADELSVFLAFSAPCGIEPEEPA